MNVSTIALDANDRYISNSGTMPARLGWDKAMLREMVKHSVVSNEGFNLLPPSIQDVARISNGDNVLPITIQEIDGLSDLILVMRSYVTLANGPKFRFDRFKFIGKTGNLEIWSRA